MQFKFTTTLLTLFGAASLTLAAPTTHNSNSVNSQTQPQQAASLQARLQLELERQTTFIQRVIPVPGRLNLHLDVFSAFIVSVEDAASGQDVSAGAVCQAFDAQENAIGGPIVLDNSVDLNGGAAASVAFIECVEV